MEYLPLLLSWSGFLGSLGWIFILCARIDYLANRLNEREMRVEQLLQQIKKLESERVR